MAQPPQPDPQINLLLSDFNTRLREIEERNRVVKERVLLLGQNLITSRDEADKEVEQLKKDTTQIKRDLDRIKSVVENLLTETDKFARKDEMILVERMLKDFQPLEFARLKDVEDMINQKLGIRPQTKPQTENIKTQKTSTREEIENAGFR